MLCGNTPTNFARIFPPEILGQGFFSRMLLIHGEPTGKKITFMKEPDQVVTKYLIDMFHRIKMEIRGKTILSPIAMKLIDKIYKAPINFYDVRFESYPTRRFAHLIKLSLIISASRLSTTVEEDDVIKANTFLTYAEHFMPKALGEFGKAKNSDVSHKVVQFIENSENPPQLSDIWMQVSNDLDRMEALGDILKSLQTADKIQSVKDPAGRFVFLLKKRIAEFNDSDVLDFSCLSKEERNKVS
jgi:DNA replicative helicase MCM subunit Mcm2 (Cdc46/Mcm family)